MRLTADLILSSPAFINPVKDRELDLRGNKISVIENMGATQDQYDTINLNDNEIQKLEGFPLFKRLKTLYLSNNRISRIVPRLGDSLPALETLILSFNKIESLNELECLAECKNLRVISLEKNPVTQKPHYRLFLIHKLPRLKLIDFQKVKPREKQEARKMFGDKAKGAAAVSASTATTSEAASTSTAASMAAPPKHVSDIAKHNEAIKAAIQNAKSLEEMQALERNLMQGVVPSAAKIKPTTMDQ